MYPPDTLSVLSVENSPHLLFYSHYILAPLSRETLLRNSLSKHDLREEVVEGGKLGKFQSASFVFTKVKPSLLRHPNHDRSFSIFSCRLENESFWEQSQG